MQTLVQDLVSQDPSIAITLGVLGVVGAFKVLSSTLSFASFLKRHLLRGTYDFKQRYGKPDSWVVVTGGSDGIGLEICYQLAAQKFNICIIGRNKSKVEEKLSEIASKHTVKTRAVIFDFASLCTIQDYKTNIGD
jgi:FlaA1/EpsC-like NDP-sugar epimerase